MKNFYTFIVIFYCREHDPYKRELALAFKIFKKSTAQKSVAFSLLLEWVNSCFSLLKITQQQPIKANQSLHTLVHTRKIPLIYMGFLINFFIIIHRSAVRIREAPPKIVNEINGLHCLKTS